jgi:hypothetical protein
LTAAARIVRGNPCITPRITLRITLRRLHHALKY